MVCFFYKLICLEQKENLAVWGDMYDFNFVTGFFLCEGKSIFSLNLQTKISKRFFSFLFLSLSGKLVCCRVQKTSSEFAKYSSVEKSQH